MDVERTMQFILEQQAATAVKLDRLKGRRDQSATRQDEIDHQTQAIQKLILTEIKMMARRDKVTDARFRAVDKRIKALAPAQPRTKRSFDQRMNALIHIQQRTEKKLNRLIGVLLGRGGKGPGRRRPPLSSRS